MASSEGASASTEKAVPAHKAAAVDVENRNRLLFVSLALLLVFSFANLIITSGMNSYVSDRLTPAELDIVAISASAGPASPGSSQFVSELKALGNVKMLSEKSVSYPADALAGELVQKYGIKTLPAVVVTGELEKLGSFLGGLGWTGGTAWFVYEASSPPYFDMASGKTIGLVKVIIITVPSCADCFNPGLLEDALKNASTSISESRTYPYSEPGGAALLANYNITKVPAIILSKDFGEYGALASDWGRLGSVEPDGSYVLRKIQPPYLDLTAKRVVGRVKLIELVDEKCTECYDVSLHRSITPRFGIANFTSIDRHDINSTLGAELASKYNIIKVPTILLSPEASKYESLGAVWPQVGSVEKDGWYVFRATEGMGTYLDRSSGKVVVPKTAAG